MTSSNFWANSIELTSGYVIMTTSWLHTLLGIHNAKQRPKSVGKKTTKEYVKIRKLILHQVLME